MKQSIIICAFLSLALMCEGQIFKDTLYRATPAERIMYRTAIKEGRGQKAVGVLIILGGSAVMTAGAGVAVAAILREEDDYYTYYDDELSTKRLLWRGGSTLFLVGLGTIGLGIDKFKEGRQSVRSAKVCFKVSPASVGLVYNF